MAAIIFNAVMLIATVLLAVVFTRAYLQTDVALPWYRRILMAFNKSWVVLWNGVIVVAVAVLDLIAYLADMLNAGAGDQLKAAVDPKYAAAIIVGILIISIIARLRTLFKTGM